MAHKTTPHVLALLRREAGLLQKELAQLIDCSLDTVKSIETGRLNLSHDLADRIRFETGVSREWLLLNDPSKGIVSENGKPFTRSSYDNFRAYRTRPDQPMDFWLAAPAVFREVRELFNLLFAGIEKHQLPLVRYKLAKVRAEIGEALNGVSDRTAFFVALARSEYSSRVMREPLEETLLPLAEGFFDAVRRHLKADILSAAAGLRLGGLASVEPEKFKKLTAEARTGPPIRGKVSYNLMDDPRFVHLKSMPSTKRRLTAARRTSKRPSASSKSSPSKRKEK
jgi:DNA-binding XRE family transcriptional regulator